MNDTGEEKSQLAESALDSIDSAKAPKKSANEPIRWTASESIEHQRSKAWYIAAILIVAAIVALSIWTKQWTMGGLAVVILVTVFVVVRKPAREIHYELNEAGLAIDGKLHNFGEFRAFGVRRDGALWQLVLTPVKRFGLSVTMFINDDQGEQIVDIFGAHLPMEEAKADIVDQLVRRLKL